MFKGPVPPPRTHPVGAALVASVSGIEEHAAPVQARLCEPAACRGADIRSWVRRHLVFGWWRRRVGRLLVSRLLRRWWRGHDYVRHGDVTAVPLHDRVLAAGSLSLRHELRWWRRRVQGVTNIAD